VNNEVPVAQLLVREGRNRSGPPNTRSRSRVIAVLLSVVLGCGAAAVMVSVGSSVQQQAQPTDRIGTVQMPQRTDGNAGADTTLDPESSSGVPAGSGAEVNVTTTNLSADQSGAPSDPANPIGETSATTGASTSRPATTGTSTRATGPVGPTSAPPPRTSTRHPQPPPPTKSPCFLGVFC
jgi:hypothetical protein